MKTLLYLRVGAIFTVMLLSLTTHAKVHFVNVLAAGLNDGSSWTDAFISVQSAIDASAPGDSIWVAAGTYFPTTRINGDSLRNSTFYINKDVLLFGGFAGVESQFGDRDPKLNITILSGDLGIPQDSTDNAFHVVYIDHVSDTMRLDGFTIELGNTTGAGGFDAYGAGLFNNASSGRSNPVIANSIIRRNWSAEGGGGMMNIAESGGRANPTFINTHFYTNESSGGGGLQNLSDSGGEISPVFINSSFKGNVARTAQGSAISSIAHSATSNIVMINSVVTGNQGNTSAAFEAFVTGTGRAAPVITSSVFSGNNGGSIRIADIGEGLSTVIVRNSILAGNGGNHGLTVNGATQDVAYSVLEFGFGGEGVISLGPEFVDPPAGYAAPHTAGDVHLLPTSPAIDAGRNSDTPAGILFDADGNSRFVNSTGLTEATIDMGAFEYQDLISGTRDVVSSLDWQVSPNPAHDFISIAMHAPGEFQCYLLQSDGRILRQFTMNAGSVQQIDISALPAGCYTMMAIQAHASWSQRFARF